MRLVQRFHDVLPGLLGKRIEELVAFAGVHRVDNGGEFAGREEIEQGVGVEIGELAHQTGREMRWQTAKQEPLLIEGQSHYGVGGLLGLEVAKEFSGSGPANLGDQIAELLNEFSHDGRTSLLQVPPGSEVDPHTRMRVSTGTAFDVVCPVSRWCHNGKSQPLVC